MLSKLFKMMGVCGLIGLIGSAQAAGSWSTSVPGVMVAMSDRETRSQSMTPPDSVQVHNRVIDRIHWQLEAPPGSAINAWLCHPEQCVALSGGRGNGHRAGGKAGKCSFAGRF